MTDKYYAFIKSVAERDFTLGILASLALALVLAWVLVDWVIPAKYREWVKAAYMAGGAALYVVTVIYSGA